MAQAAIPKGGDRPTSYRSERSARRARRRRGRRSRLLPFELVEQALDREKVVALHAPAWRFERHIVDVDELALPRVAGQLDEVAVKPRPDVVRDCLGVLRRLPRRNHHPVPVRLGAGLHVETSKPIVVGVSRLLRPDEDVTRYRVALRSEASSEDGSQTRRALERELLPSLPTKFARGRSTRSPA